MEGSSTPEFSTRTGGGMENALCGRRQDWEEKIAPLMAVLRYSFDHVYLHRLHHPLHKLSLIDVEMQSRNAYRYSPTNFSIN